MAEVLEDRTLLATFTANSFLDKVDLIPGNGVVDTGTPGEVTLRAAIMEANALTGDDVINLPAGTYTLSIAGSGEDAAATGDLDITDTTGSLTIAGTGTTTIDAGGAGGLGDRVFEVRSSVTVTLQNLTITGGSLDGSVDGGDAFGGGIYNEGTLTIENSTISNNEATGGDGYGGYSGEGGDAFGGGIYNLDTLTIKDSTISDNDATGGDGIGYGYGGYGYGGCGRGGGIFNEGTLTIENSTISGNDATGGDGIGGDDGYGYGGDSGEGGHAFGGGIYNLDVLTIKDSTISNNDATGGDGFGGDGDGYGGYGYGGYGGDGDGGDGCGSGIFNEGTLTIENSTISDNEVTGGDGFGGDGYDSYGGYGYGYGGYGGDGDGGDGCGGGIFNEGTLTIENSTISDNEVTGGDGFGGDAYGYGGYGYGGYGGDGYGGGIFNEGTLTIENSTISDNKVTGGDGFGGDAYGYGGYGYGGYGFGGDGHGGGIGNNSTSLVTIYNSTLTLNSAKYGGGIWESDSPETIEIGSTIVAQNTADTDADIHADSVVSFGFNLIGDVGTGVSGLTNGEKADQVGGSTRPVIDAKLGLLQGNGGPTETHALETDSPAIDQGRAWGLTGDQRGFTRPIDYPGIPNATGGDGSDIGAYELQCQSFDFIADFNSGLDDFAYRDDVCGTNHPAYADGRRDATGGPDGSGALFVTVGGVDRTDVSDGMSGGWQREFTLGEATPVTVSFDYKLTQTRDYEKDEWSEVRYSVDGLECVTVDRTEGDGRCGGFEQTTGWQHFTVDLGTLSAGSHTLTIGGYNNKKTYTNESTEVLIDNVAAAETVDSPSTEWVYVDDLFRGTNEPDYADGTDLPSGDLQVVLGNVDGRDILGMSGGWQRSFHIDAPTPMTVSFDYQLTQAGNYETDEWSQVLVNIDGGPPIVVDRIDGNGQGGPEQTTGRQCFQVDVGTLSAGDHTLAIGGYNNKKTYHDESTEVLIDNVAVTETVDPPPTGPVYSDDLFRGTNEPDYADGTELPCGELQIILGNVDARDILGMSGGSQLSFHIECATLVTVSFDYSLTQAGNYETDEWSEVLLNVDDGAAIVVDRIDGDGQGGPEQTTGRQPFQVDVGTLSAGDHTVAIGGYNNKKTYTDESTEVLIANASITSATGESLDSAFETFADWVDRV